MKTLRRIAVLGLLLPFAATAADPELIISEELAAKQSSNLYIVQMSEMPAIAESMSVIVPVIIPNTFAISVVL